MHDLHGPHMLKEMRSIKGMGRDRVLYTLSSFTSTTEPLCSESTNAVDLDVLRLLTHLLGMSLITRLLLPAGREGHSTLVIAPKDGGTCKRREC
jgi:hypothetical protein